jgi:hypothetical protein
MELLSITYWREYLDMVLLYKLINNYTYIDENAPPIIAESGKTRRETNENVIRFVMPFAKTVTYQSSYLIRACKTWNVLNSELSNIYNLCALNVKG